MRLARISRAGRLRTFLTPEEFSIEKPPIATSRDRIEYLARLETSRARQASATGQADRAMLHSFLAGIFKGAVDNDFDVTPAGNNHPEYATEFSDKTLPGPLALEHAAHSLLARMDEDSRWELLRTHHAVFPNRNAAWQQFEPSEVKAALTYQLKCLDDSRWLTRACGEYGAIGSASLPFIASVTVFGHALGVFWPISDTAGTTAASTFAALSGSAKIRAFGARFAAHANPENARIDFEKFSALQYPHSAYTRQAVAALKQYDMQARHA